MIAWLMTKKLLFFIPFSEVVKVLLDQGLGGQNEQGIRHHKGCTADH
jgi:hypothetical protein